MKKLFYLFLFVGLAVISCNKPDSTPTEIEVSFEASMGSANFKASTCTDCPVPSIDCNKDEAVTAKLIISDGTNDLTFTVNMIHEASGAVYTQSIKLPAPTQGTSYTLTSFELYNAAGDCILATPTSASLFGEFLTPGESLPKTFEVDPFLKNKVSVQILCYEPTQIEAFGFSWFTFDDITVRELCFFGDICAPDTMDYVGSEYEHQANHLQHDMPAIFRVEVSQWNNALNGGLGDWDQVIVNKNNLSFYGEGAPLCIQYPDYTGTDLNKIELYVYNYVSPGVFDWVLYKTWNEYEGDNPVNDIGDDGVIDFVLGDCVGGDIVFTDPEPPVEPPATGDCDDCEGKITQLTLKYTGSSTATIEVKDKKGSLLLYSGTVASGSNFSFGKYPGKTDVGPEVKVYVNGTLINIHTSCSQPIGIGSTYTSGGITLTIMAGESRIGGFLCAI